MARTFTAASSMSEQVVAQIRVGTPVSIGVWFRPTSGQLTAHGTMMDLDQSNGTNFIGIQFNGSAIHAYQFDGTNTADGGRQSTAGLNGVWHHYLGVFQSTTSTQGYLDGVAGTLDATSSSPSQGVERGCIGCTRTNAAATNFWDGDLAEVAVWSTNLRAIDATQLAAGFSPLIIQPDKLVGYWPLWGNDSPDTDWSPSNLSGIQNSMTLFNSPVAAASNPPVIPLNATPGSPFAIMGPPQPFFGATTPVALNASMQPTGSLIAGGIFKKSSSQRSIVYIDGNRSVAYNVTS